MDAIDRFEAEAKSFEKVTGHMMPGKDIPAAGWAGEESEEERQFLYKAWCGGKRYSREATEDLEAKLKTTRILVREGMEWFKEMRHSYEVELDETKAKLLKIRDIIPMDFLRRNDSSGATGPTKKLDLIQSVRDMVSTGRTANTKLKEAEQELLKDRCHHADMMSQAEIGYGIQIRNLETENSTLRKGMSESAVMFEARARGAESKMKDYEEAFLDSNAKRIHTREALNESKAWSKQLEESISRADARNEDLLEGVKLLRDGMNKLADFASYERAGFEREQWVGSDHIHHRGFAKEILTRTAKLVEGE